MSKKNDNPENHGTASAVQVKRVVRMPKIKITSVPSKNGLYHIEMQDDNKISSVSEILKILREPVPKIDKITK